MAALQAIGVPDDSPLRNPEQIPFPKPPPPIQNPSGADDEEDTPSIRELVHKIDSHMELVDVKVTSNLNVALHDAQLARDVQAQPLPTAQPGKDASAQPIEDLVPLQPTDLVA